MIRVNQIKTEKGAGLSDVKRKAAGKLRISVNDIREIRILKHSVDARKKDRILDIYSVAVVTDLPEGKEEKVIRRAASKDVLKYEPQVYHFPKASGERTLRPVIAGYGPAGIFTAYLLAMHGYAPLVIERGYEIEKRDMAVQRFFETGVLDPRSNVQFGEGGAGTFSDGKLNTLVKDEHGRSRFVLETFVRFGAPESILYDAKPHLGTDLLLKIIPAIRKETIRLGGEIRFEAELTDILIRDGALTGIEIGHTESLKTSALFLCLGHSARDTVRMLHRRNLVMEAKPFAAGVRAEHRREMIDAALHLEKASYKVTHRCRDGRGVYSFCMCPGGYVVNSSSEPGRLTVNGMSYSGRSGENSNAAVVVTVTPGDFGGDPSDPLRGILFQQALEEKAVGLCGGRIPYQRYGDFKRGEMTEAFGAVRPMCKGAWAFGNLREIFPDHLAEDIIEGIEAFEKQIPGYASEDTLISGVEARTSSPVRILRDDSLQAQGIRGIYPAGEGAGYAGGIMSAAMDGMKAAEAYAAGQESRPG